MACSPRRARLLAQAKALRAEGIGSVLAEQNLDFVLDLADRVWRLGKVPVRWPATPAEMRSDVALREWYLTA